MKRVLILALFAVMAYAGLEAVNAVAANAMTCSPISATRPSLNSGIHTSYSVTCTHEYFVTLDVEYESGGTWHGTQPIKQIPTQSQVNCCGGWNANSHHADSLVFTGVTGVNGSIAPYCQYNLRIDFVGVAWDPQRGVLDGVEVHSPVLSATC